MSRSSTRETDPPKADPGLAPNSDADIQAARLAAIVACSDDAIISKSLEGRITSWNAGATKIFGYTAEEMIGEPIKKIIPPELHAEEDDILARLSQGQHIDHFDTVRLAKNGRRVDISLTVSPLRDRTGRIVGASKVARDVTERKKSEQLQRLLFAELNHRVKNTLATIQAIAGQSQRSATDPAHFVASFNGRISALARAHDVLVRSEWNGAELEDLLREQVVLGAPDQDQIRISGPTVLLKPQLAVQLALVLHELTTNARKHGALSIPGGRLDISWDVTPGATRALRLDWRERRPGALTPPDRRGFGTNMIERSLQASGGSVELEFEPSGLHCTIRLPLPEDWGEMSFAAIKDFAGDHAREADDAPSGREQGSPLQGLRVLIIEDEPMIAMDIEEHLKSAGCEIAGSAGTLESAQTAVEGGDFDIVFLDANLAGRSVENLAAELSEQGAPFAFATGYGAEALPEAFRDRPVLIKPIPRAELLATARRLAQGER